MKTPWTKSIAPPTDWWFVEKLNLTFSGSKIICFEVPIAPTKLAPIGSMYGIFTYIWLIFMVNVGKYMDPMGHSLWKRNIIFSLENQSCARVDPLPHQKLNRRSFIGVYRYTNSLLLGWWVYPQLCPIGSMYGQRKFSWETSDIRTTSQSNRIAA